MFITKNIQNNIKNRTVGKFLILGVLGTMFLNGCSTAYNSGYSSPQSRSMPVVPEITRPVVRRPTVKKPTVKQYKPSVRKYSAKKPTKSVISKKEVAPVITKEERIKQAQKAATIEFDPYANVPENGSVNKVSVEPQGKTNSGTVSSAVKSLILRARAELAIGNTKSAVSNLERGLRIESNNPELWNLLAKANYDQSSYQQSISMAKKSIRYSSNDDMIAKNWKLIQKAGERSGDTVVVKEALNYFKVNP